jgi:uncharacterized protein YndB with AHSA1/START domain
VIRSRHSIHIDRPVDEVFDYLRDHENRIYWQGNLVEHAHERLAKGSRITEARNVLGRRVEINGEITEYESDRRFTFVGSGPHVKRLEYRYVLEPDDGGTRLDTEVEVELPESFGLAVPVIQRLTDRELEHAHTTLKDILEDTKAHEMAKQLPRHKHHTN